MSPTPQRLFVSYSHGDEKWLRRFQVHLAPLMRQRPVEIWADSRLAAGDEWRQEIERAIQGATIAILLVSPDFLASDFIAKDELPPILSRAAAGKLRVMWLAISHSLYANTAIARYQALNDPKKPLSGLKTATVDRMLVAACEAIEKATNQSPSNPWSGSEQPLESVGEVEFVNLFWATVDRYRMYALGGQVKERAAADLALSSSRGFMPISLLRQILDGAPNDGEIQMAVAVVLGSSTATHYQQQQIVQMLSQLLRSPFERARYRAAYSIQRYHRTTTFYGGNHSAILAALSAATRQEPAEIVRHRMAAALMDLEEKK